MSINPKSVQKSEIECKKVKLSAKKSQIECKSVKLKMIDSFYFELDKQNGGQKLTKIETLYLYYLIKKQSAKLNNSYYTSKS